MSGQSSKGCLWDVIVRASRARIGKDPLSVCMYEGGQIQRLGQEASELRAEEFRCQEDEVSPTLRAGLDNPEAGLS